MKIFKYGFYVGFVYLIYKILGMKNGNGAIMAGLSGYVGQKEWGTNKGFESANFESKMRNVGWRPDDQWCAFFVKLIFKEGHPRFYAKAMEDRAFSGAVSRTWDRMRANGHAVELNSSQSPRAGDIIVWHGHIAIVEDFDGTMVTTIGGNEDDSVKRRELYYSSLKNDSTLRGYLRPNL